jgi:hypothetical protein
MPLDPDMRAHIEAEAKRRGVDPAAAIARAEERAPTAAPAAKDAPDDKPGRPVADRLLVGFLPFIKVRELRAVWLGLDERIPDDEMTCGDYQVAHGGAAAAPATDSPAGGA